MPEQKEILESIRDVLKGEDDVLELTQKVNPDGSITEITPKARETAPVKIEPVLNIVNESPPVELEAMPDMVEEVRKVGAAPETAPDDILSEIDSILNSKDSDEKVELEFTPKAPPQKFEIVEEFEPSAPEVPPTTSSQQPAAPTKPPQPTDFSGHNIMPRIEEDMEENVTADDAKNSISELMGKLKKQGKEANAPKDAAPFRSGATLEDLVMEMLKPLMQDWLETHLPKLVKETVQKEIGKLIPKE